MQIGRICIGILYSAPPLILCMGTRKGPRSLSAGSKRNQMNREQSGVETGEPFNQLAEPDIPEMKDAPTADLLDRSYSGANDPAQCIRQV